jgi:hypothetical protein
MSETPRYPNGQPVGYSNRGLCDKCAGDIGDCNCARAYECTMCGVTSRNDKTLDRSAGRACPFCGEGVIVEAENA